MMWAALAYTLMQRLRAIALQGTELARTSAATIRTRLLKIGATIVRHMIVIPPLAEARPGVWYINRALFPIAKSASPPDLSLIHI